MKRKYHTIGGVSMYDDSYQKTGTQVFKRIRSNTKLVWKKKLNYYPVPALLDEEKPEFVSVDKDQYVFLRILGKELLGRFDLDNMIWRKIAELYAQNGSNKIMKCRLCKQLRTRFCYMSCLRKQCYPPTLMKDKGFKLNECCSKCLKNLQDFYWMDSWESIMPRDEVYYESKRGFNPPGEFCRLKALQGSSPPQ